MFGQHPFPDSPLGRSHLVNFVRATDKALREYEFGRVSAADFMAHKDEGRVSPYFKAIDHFESSINATFRALSYCDRLRKLGLPVEFESGESYPRIAG